MVNWFSKSSKVSHPSFLDNTKYAPKTHVDVSDYPSLQRQLQVLNLTTDDLAIIKQLEPYAQEIIPVMVDQFYEAITLSPELVTIIKNTTQIERLKITLHRHLEGIFKCQIDANYIMERQTIAQVHVRIGLQSKWYIASFQSLMSTFISFIEKIKMPPHEMAKAINAFSKMINLEQQLVIEAYEMEEQRIR
ncbi:MAG TPA: protoglobin domain-containing protein, partial [Solibacillus sp.]